MPMSSSEKTTAFVFVLTRRGFCHVSIGDDRAGAAYPHDLKGDLIKPPAFLDLLAGQLLLRECSALVQSGPPSASTLAVVKPPARNEECM